MNISENPQKGFLSLISLISGNTNAPNQAKLINHRINSLLLHKMYILLLLKRTYNPSFIKHGPLKWHLEAPRPMNKGAA